MFGVQTIATCDKGWCSFHMVYIVPWNVHLQLFNLEIYCTPRTSVRLWIPSHSSEFSFNSLFVTLSSQWWIRLASLLNWTVNKNISLRRPTSRSLPLVISMEILQTILLALSTLVLGSCLEQEMVSIGNFSEFSDKKCYSCSMSLKSVKKLSKALAWKGHPNICR